MNLPGCLNIILKYFRMEYREKKIGKILHIFMSSPNGYVILILILRKR